MFWRRKNLGRLTPAFSPAFAMSTTLLRSVQLKEVTDLWRRLRRRGRRRRRRKRRRSRPASLSIWGVSPNRESPKSGVGAIGHPRRYNHGQTKTKGSFFQIPDLGVSVDLPTLPPANMEVQKGPLSERKVVFLQGSVDFHVSWWEGKQFRPPTWLDGFHQIFRQPRRRKGSGPQRRRLPRRRQNGRRRRRRRRRMPRSGPQSPGSPKHGLLAGTRRTARLFGAWIPHRVVVPHVPLKLPLDTQKKDKPKWRSILVSEATN